MSQSTPNGSGSKRISLQRPAAGTREVLTGLKGETLKFEFALAEGTFSRQGNDILITFEDGAVLVLKNFFADRDSVPNFEDAGELLDGIAFLKALNIDTAFGGASRPSPRGSGVGSYDDSPGELVDTVERLDDLGTSRREWSNATLSTGKDLSDAYEDPLVDISIAAAFKPELALNEAHLAGGTDAWAEGAVSEWTVLELPAGVFIVGVPTDPEAEATRFTDANGVLYVRCIGNGQYEYRYEMNSPFAT
ncbi:hypothetical protein LJC59_08520, partial [Desulfovibrio sp. OttesenSCG-928-A18]|nr:hypothetical protein [Desulfovibrio sp. OttesenSCG-928-A18]